jgi:DNA-binding MarR family transcriptional regulator
MVKITMNRLMLAHGRTSKKTKDKLIDLLPLQNHTAYLLRRTQMAVSDELSLLLRKLDLKPMQYMILALIEANPKIQQGSAAEILGIQKTNFVAIVTNLSELGLIERKAVMNDRRSFGLVLTSDGQKLYKQAHAIVQAHEQRLKDRLGADLYNSFTEPLMRLALDDMKPN